MSKRGSSVLVAWGAAALAAFLGLTAPAMGADEERTVNEKILDILLEQGTIDLDRHEELSEEAQEEKRLLALARAAEEPEPDPTGWRAYWRDHLRVERNDGAFEVGLGGRIDLDFTYANADDAVFAEFPDSRGHGVDFRRARLFAQGRFGEHAFFKSEFGFAGAEVKFQDVFVGLRELPVLGNLRVGHFFEPTTLELLTSAKFITFMERALPVVAFSPGRNTGIGVNDQAFDERMTWSLGVFREVGRDGSGFSNESAYNTTIRVTTLPVWEDEGRQLVHTGLWYSHKFRGDGLVRYEADAESNTVGNLLGTPDITTDGVDIVGAELAFVLGPFSMQGEYIHSFVKGGSGQRDENFYGAYLYASYFLTGERRPYSRTRGAFGRVRPTHTFSLSEGSYGALEVAARWSYLDLNSGSVRGGIQSDMTLGVNWYLYSNLRLMLNYVLAHRNGVGNANILQSRVGLDF